MIQRFSADIIVSGDGTNWNNHHILLDRNKIIGVYPNASSQDIKYHKGVICPGFINAHCHLELSHLKNIINTGTGLIEFIKGVVTLRDFPHEVIIEAIAEADQEMYDNGIVAVGDISNTLDTVYTKNISLIDYCTFVEMFDFLQEAEAKSNFDKYYQVYEGQSRSGKNKVSCVPHAPYSVSPKLFELINRANTPDAIISIHNQELKAENNLFLNKSGGFVDFYKEFGIPLDKFEATGYRSIDYALSHMNSAQPTLMIHNTQSRVDDILNASTWSDQVYWVSCPNANLYIENKLPNYKLFIDQEVTICLGTDSLSSNWQLSILEEMKTIKKYQSGVSDYDILTWATSNGAKALGYNEHIGSITPGKSPGINLIDVDVNENEFNLSEACGVKRLDI